MNNNNNNNNNNSNNNNNFSGNNLSGTITSLPSGDGIFWGKKNIYLAGNSFTEINLKYNSVQQLAQYLNFSGIFFCILFKNIIIISIFVYIIFNIIFITKLPLQLVQCQPDLWPYPGAALRATINF